jgi:hypothetical protein
MSHRSTTYPCFLPDLGEFSGSWSHETYPGAKIGKKFHCSRVPLFQCYFFYSKKLLKEWNSGTLERIYGTLELLEL